jgi:hypothetical protein
VTANTVGFNDGLCYNHDAASESSAWEGTMSACARSFFRTALSAALLLGLSATAPAADAPTECKLPNCAKTMDEVRGVVANVSKIARPEDTLVVFDIDNTLLKMNQDLGSDAWFNWQNGLLKVSPPSGVAHDINGLLNIQRLLYDLSGMGPPESSTPEFVAELRSVGYPVMMLTGRGPGTLSATLRELADEKYIPKDALACGPPECGDVLCSTPGVHLDGCDQKGVGAHRDLLSRFPARRRSAGQSSTLAAC